jgi:hypothetical protein
MGHGKHGCIHASYHMISLQPSAMPSAAPAMPQITLHVVYMKWAIINSSQLFLAIPRPYPVNSVPSISALLRGESNPLVVLRDIRENTRTI